MDITTIRINNLSKSYRLGSIKRHATHLSEAIANTFSDSLQYLLGKRQADEGDLIWALKNVSLEVNAGDAVGFVGLNGAGKSTLLKIVSRITEPTEGTVELYGSVGSLLEVGIGFHGELTGRDNIYLSGAMLGMSRTTINRKFDEIVDFAEVEKYLETPVKRYSSGMYVRLAFAVAAYLEQDILIVDEVLAVGDTAFQQKCLHKMNDIAQQGRTILYVSHNLASISTLCNKAIYFKEGNIQLVGAVEDVVPIYLADAIHDEDADLIRLRKHGMGAEIKFTDIHLLSSTGAAINYEQPLRCSLSVKSDANLTNLNIGLGIFDVSGIRIGTAVSQQSFSITSGQQIDLTVTVPYLNIAPGQYHAGFTISHGESLGHWHVLDEIIGKPVFQILPGASNALLSAWNAGLGSVVFKDLEIELVSSNV